MNKNCIPIVQILAMLLAALMLGKASPTAAQSRPVPTLRIAAAEVPDPERSSDIHALIYWLEKAAAWPEAAAGSSLRLALLAAELSDWAAGNALASPSAEAELLSFLHGLNDADRAVLIRHIAILRDFCASLTPRQYRDLLVDAGMDAVYPVPEIGSLTGLLQGIADAAVSVSIQNRPEK